MLQKQHNRSCRLDGRSAATVAGSDLGGGKTLKIWQTNGSISVAEVSRSRKRRKDPASSLTEMSTDGNTCLNPPRLQTSEETRKFPATFRHLESVNYSLFRGTN